jgi:hypothetical protein
MKLFSHGSASEYGALFQNTHRLARARQISGTHEPVVPTADDDDVVGLVLRSVHEVIAPRLDAQLSAIRCQKFERSAAVQAP